MGLLGWLKLGLRLRKLKQAMEESKMDWRKSALAGGKALLEGLAGVVGAAALGYLSNADVVTKALEGSLAPPVLALLVPLITGLAGFARNAWKHR